MESDIKPRFRWDEIKNLSNQRKHGISFQEASKVFSDPLYISVQDRVVDGEERWQSFGIVRGVLLLMVAHTFHEEDSGQEIIRIISARTASANERRRYERENRELCI